ncbi:hypothetical protein [Acetobacterium wieringae]|uniref:hypothetical protein n=1 Tax=Acetobacterium wieringae TaxID=52694 RepID=UPI002B219131|nr:hypothetical protein [Acetobacterium wieringae]MEA4806697.1 hypothetical protein [Acetobacterium wieringae]
MNDLLLLCGAMLIVVYLIILSRTIKNIEPSIRLSNAFVAVACLLICFSYTSYINFITLPWEIISIRAIFFNFGLVAFLAGLFIMFVELLKDPLFKYSPYVIIIGVSFLMMYVNIAMSVV